MRVNSLTTRFLLALLLSTALPFLVFGWYARMQMRESLEQEVVDVYLPREAANAGRHIESSLASARRAGWFLATAVRSLCQEVGELDAFEQLVASIAGANPSFDLVILADGEGEVLCVSRSPRINDPEKEDELAFLEPTSVASFDWFQQLRSGSVAEVWIDRHFSPFLHRNTEQTSKNPDDYSLGLALPVQMADGSLGVLYCLLRWQQMQDVLDSTGSFLVEDAQFNSAKVFLCNKDGGVLAHTDRQQYGEVLYPGEFLQAVLNLENGSGKASFISKTGESRRAGFTRIPITESNFDWYIGLHATDDELFKKSREFGQQLLVVMAIVIAVISLWSMFASRAIIRPVKRLSEATRRVSGGDLSVRVDAKGSTELADLSRSFNSMAVDLSENREKLRNAERQAAWAEMARQIAHEIKNPLTPMRMGAQLLLRAKNDQDPRWESLSDRLARTVIQQTSALDRIAEDFRQFAGAPSRDVRLVSADEILKGVGELVSSMSEVASIDVRFSFAAAEAQVLADKQEMRRLFLNLIHNASQACVSNGVIEMSSAVEGQEVVYRVMDNGPGVPDELRERLFEPYFTTKTSGTGLGLAICRKLAEAHGGSIELEQSSPGRTVFSVKLPLAPPS